MKSCHDCKYYHAEYGGVCFAQKDAPRVFWQVAETCDDFTYKDARILLDPISLSKEQVRDIYEFLDGKANPTGEELYKNICEDISRAITERLTAEAERLMIATDRDRRIGFKNIRLEHFVRTCKKCSKKFITLYRVAKVCPKCQEEKEKK